MGLINNLYGQLRDISNDLYFITDLNGNFIDINPKAVEILGIDESKILQTYNIKDFFMNYSDWDNYTLRMENRDNFINGLDITFKKYDKSFFTGLLSSRLVKNPGEQICRIFMVHDISDYLESALDAMKLNLELLDKNRQLNNAHIAISHQEKLASIGELSAGVAHEINNPLAFVSSNIRSMTKYTERVFGYKFDLAEEQKEEFNFIKEDLQALFEETKEGLDRIENITKSLKRFSRMDADSKTSKYDLNKAIEDTILISKSQCPVTTEIQLELSELPLIECYANDLNQVLLNMVINALQAQSEMAADFKGSLKIYTSAKKNKVEIVFEDNGPGIPENIENKIYDPFFTTKEIGKGTGLGLGICFNIINNKHNGALWLDSRSNPTRFKINIPTVLGGVEHG